MNQELWDSIISTSVGGAVGGAFAGLVLYSVQQGHLAIRDWLDTRRLEKWMKSNSGPFDIFGYRTTRSIASHNNMTEDRVRFICSHSTSIYMSRGQNEDRWTLNKELEDYRELIQDD